MSNPSAVPELELVKALLSRSEPCGDACNPGLRGARQVHIRDKVDVDEMVRHFANGTMIVELAASYGISESSVKRLLRARGVRRR